MKKQQGISLLEIMVALALSLLIIAGVVRMVGTTISNERLLSSELETQESANFLTNRLGLIFKQALSSPCGDINSMLADNSDPTSTSYLKRSKLRDAAGNLIPQPLPNIIIPRGPLDASVDSGTIRADDFPLLVAGRQGDILEPQYLDINDNLQPISNLLTGIVDGSDYIVVMETSEKILINTATLGGVRGGQNVVGGVLANAGTSIIPTSLITNNVGNPNTTPYLITDCTQGDIFMPNAPVQANGIPVDNNLFFSGLLAGYKPGESVIGPIEVFAYYVRDRPVTQPEISRNFMRLNITRANAGAVPQPILGGVDEITYSWGFGQGTDTQGYFTTAQILAEGFNLANFRQNLVSVRINMQIVGFNNQTGEFNRDASGAPTTRNNPVKSVDRIITLRNKAAR